MESRESERSDGGGWRTERCDERGEQTHVYSTPGGTQIATPSTRPSSSPTQTSHPFSNECAIVESNSMLVIAGSALHIPVHGVSGVSGPERSEERSSRERSSREWSKESGAKRGAAEEGRDNQTYRSRTTRPCMPTTRSGQRLASATTLRRRWAVTVCCTGLCGGVLWCAVVSVVCGGVSEEGQEK